MDRSTWMYKIPRGSTVYLDYMSGFMKTIEDYKVREGKPEILCPCKVCKICRLFVNSHEIFGHLITNGFVDKYTTWSRHGELLSNSNLVVFNSNNNDNEELIMNDSCDNLEDILHDLEDKVSEKDYDKFQQLFEDSEKPLYVGCTKFTKLSAVLKLFHLKANNGWSDKSFTSLLEILHEMLPEDNELPVSLYQAKKLMFPMRLEIVRRHSCPNDCILYRNEYENLHECVKCGASRYKQKRQINVNNDDITKNGPPAKLLWYLPIMPRLRRLFANPNDAKLLRWHKEERKNDGKLRHVADSSQWRNIDYEFEEFGEEIET